MRTAVSSGEPAALAAVFAALGDPVRLQIVSRLRDGPQSTVRLTAGTPVTRQAMTKHLEVLQRAGLLISDRRGRERLWQVQPTRLGEVRRYLAQIERDWDAALQRLKAYVEDDETGLR